MAETMAFIKFVNARLKVQGEDLKAFATEIRKLTDQDRVDLARYAYEEDGTIVTKGGQGDDANTPLYNPTAA